MNRISLIISLILPAFISAQSFSFQQAETGPGGSEYKHQEVIIHDFASKPDGYWLYEPAQPSPKEANVVVFIHGYGAYNPMIYGKWIKHLVKKGNIVIFPRYQKNLMSPKPKDFAGNVATAIRDALVELDSGQHVKPILTDFSLVGHSYGGVISAGLAVNYETHKIPKPQAVMLCSPGTGPFKGGRLETYKDIPEDTRLLVMVSNDDRTVGDEFGILVYETATKVKYRNFIRQYADSNNGNKITAGHNQCYSLDTTLDTGVRNFTAKRALRISKLDAVDYFAYWKLFDALLDCTRKGTNCKYAFDDNEEQNFMGLWEDGTAIRKLEISIPDQKNLQKTEKD